MIAARHADLIVNFGRVDYLWSLARTSKPLAVVFNNPAIQDEMDFVERIRTTRIRFVGVSANQMSDLAPQVT